MTQKMFSRLSISIILFAFAMILMSCVAAETPAPSLPTAAATPLGGGTGRLAFTSNSDGKEGNHRIYTSKLDGSDLQKLNFDYNVNNPVWTRDGTRFAYSSLLSAIYVWQVGAPVSGELIKDDFPKIPLEWSPDDQQLLYISSEGSKLGLYSVQVTGKGKKFLSPDLYWVMGGSWSPDGAKIAVMAMQKSAGAMGIYIMDNTGGNLKLVLNDEGSIIGGIDWSPDGKKIVYTHHQNKGGVYSDQIKVIQVDGSLATVLTAFGENSMPKWSPDGKMIAFVSNRDGNNEIYVMNADGSNQRRVTSNSAQDTWPDWQPYAK